MPLLPRPLRWWRPAVVFSLVLAGCATTMPPPRPPLTAGQQRELLLQLSGFSLSGRVGVKTSAQEGFNAGLDWQQQQDLAKVKLSGPLGAGSLQLEYGPQQLRVVTGRGDRLTGGEAEQALARELGFVPPFEALRYWIRGIPAPGAAAATATYDSGGVLQQLQQLDWLIRYQGFMQVNTRAGSVQLPAKLVATHDQLRLTLVVDRWRVK